MSLSGRGARPVVAILVMAALPVLLAGPASADPAGPTDYRSEVVLVEPAHPGLDLVMIGGDSFLQLTVSAGTEVMVIGYQGEPYLHFSPDGTVTQNERSPSRWLNDDRFGEASVPPDASAEAEPDWVVVATDGSFAWHDHRTHWMNSARPPGKVPGDTVLEAVVPLEVDGVAVDVHVRSELLSGPSLVGPAVGVVAAAVSALAAVVIARQWSRELVVPVVVGIWAALAAALGAWAVLSVPAETGPSPMLWLMPAVGVVASAAAWWFATRASSSSPAGRPPMALLTVWGLVAVAGLELVAWSWTRRLALTRALIPSDAPAVLDRAVVAAAAVAGLIALAVAAANLAWPRPR